MKVSYPLSLKVSLWLMVNLLLLAGLGIGFFIIQGGLGWDALVGGPTGERVQSLFNVIAGEASVASGDARNAVLKRFGTAYGAELFLLGMNDTRLAGNSVEFPAAVRERIELRGPSWMYSSRFPGPRSPSSGRDGRRSPDGGNEGAKEVRRSADPGTGTAADSRRAAEGGSAATGETRRSPEVSSDGSRKRESSSRVSRTGGDRSSREAHDQAEAARSGAEPGRHSETRPGFAGPPPPDRRSGRFLARTTEPTAYWVGLRVPFAPPERNNRAVPALLVARVTSLWGLLQLIGLQSWLLAGGGVLALSILFWLPLVGSITRSLGQLTTATEKIAEGHFDTRVTTRRHDELGRLGESVNRMAARLDTHMTGQKRFLGDVAHELCSPLARLQMATGILADQAPEKLQATVTDVREEVQQMSTLVNELLAFTKAGMQSRDLALTKVPLEPLARETLAQEGAGDRATLAVPPGLTAMADPDLLARALANLVRNALRYAGEAGPIAVTAVREGNRVVLAVEDAGPGVPPADLDRLGEPFFRPELARTRESGGVGLGLAIVRSSIAACQGEVRFSNREPRGFRAELRLAAS